MADKAKSIENLLKSTNDASGQARTMWLSFLGLLTYLLVTIAGTTHVDLLLNNPVELPIVNVEIPLFSFFIYVPVLLLIFHLGLLIQHAMLGRKLHSLNEKLKDGRFKSSTVHDYRSLLHSYVVSQLIAGPERHALLDILMRLIVWVSLLVLPVVTFCYFQYAFLSYHDVATTYWHRIAFMADLALLIAVWPFMRVQKILQSSVYVVRGTNLWIWRSTSWALTLGGFGTAILILFNWFVATIPFENTDKVSSKMHSWVVQLGGRPVFVPTAVLFQGEVNEEKGTLDSWFSRNLVVTDTDMVPNKDDAHGEVSHSLRGRDLRYAVLDRSDLHRADLSWAQLLGASLISTNLNRTKLHFTKLRKANLQAAKLESAALFNADLRRANLNLATMKKAILKLAKLQGVDLRRAQMQGANLRFAAMQGANLRFAAMQGADLGGAKMQGADLGRAEIWQVTPVNSDQIKDADLRTISLSPFYPDAARAVLAGLIQVAVRKRVAARLAPMLVASEVAAWAGSDELKTWRHFSSVSRSAPAAVAKILTDLACKDDTGGYIIKGIARRVTGFLVKEEDYAKRTAAKLRDIEVCSAAKHLSEETLAKLRKIPPP